MALIRKDNPVNIDGLIDKLQYRLWSGLSFFQSGWQSYPRCYLNPVSGQSTSDKKAEYFNDGEYQDCLVDDNFNLVTFWLEGNSKTINETRYQSQIELYVQCSNLKALYPSVTHRADEELVNDFINALTANKGASIQLRSVEKGIDNIYSGIYRKALRYDDMNEYFVFKIVFDAFYKNCKC